MKTKKFLILILIGVLIVCSVFSAPHLRKYDTEQKEDYRVQHGHGSSGPSGGNGSSGGDGNIVVEEGVAAGSSPLLGSGKARLAVTPGEAELKATPGEAELAATPGESRQASLGGERQASLGGARQASLGGARQASLGGARQASLGGARQASLRGARQARSSPSHGGGGGSETERSNNQRLQWDTSQTPENQAEQGRFFEVCSTEKIILIVLGLSLLVSVIINFVCCFNIRKRDHGRRHYDPSNEDRYQFVNDPSNEDRYQSVNETERSNIQRLQWELNELQKKYDALRKEKKPGRKESLVKEIEELKQDYDAIRKKFNAVGYVAEREWSSIVKAQANVTLNPDTANPSLAVSLDGSQVRFKGEGSAEWPSVLSREGFTSGRHYWEVEVGEKGYWALGISTYLDEKIIPEKPEEGYWLLRRWKGNMYEAVSQSLVPLTLQHKLYKVGMILDYQKGELSFYNVYDGSTRYEIHTFTYKFTEVYPVFSPGSHDRGPLKIARFKSGDGNPNL